MRAVGQREMEVGRCVAWHQPLGLIEPTQGSLFYLCCSNPTPCCCCCLPPPCCSADEVVVSTAGEGLAERVKEITGGEGAYSAIECVGGDLFAAVSERPAPLTTAASSPSPSHPTPSQPLSAASPPHGRRSPRRCNRRNAHRNCGWRTAGGPTARR